MLVDPGCVRWRQVGGSEWPFIILLLLNVLVFVLALRFLVLLLSSSLAVF